MNDPPAPHDRSSYWDDRYQQVGDTDVSWFQRHPIVSLDLIAAASIEPSTPVIDVGGGGARLVDHLLARGFTDITVLDVSGTALDRSRQRLAGPDAVNWLRADVLTWQPTRQWGLWHDRAVFHFLTEQIEQADYLDRLRNALCPGGTFVIGTFAVDGPDRCSGLPVCRYDAISLGGAIVSAIPTATIGTACREVHTTPNGSQQPFTWVTGHIAG